MSESRLCFKRVRVLVWTERLQSSSVGCLLRVVPSLSACVSLCVMLLCPIQLSVLGIVLSCQISFGTVGQLNQLTTKDG